MAPLLLLVWLYLKKRWRNWDLVWFGFSPFSLTFLCILKFSLARIFHLSLLMHEIKKKRINRVKLNSRSKPRMYMLLWPWAAYTHVAWALISRARTWLFSLLPLSFSCFLILDPRMLYFLNFSFFGVFPCFFKAKVRNLSFSSCPSLSYLCNIMKWAWQRRRRPMMMVFIWVYIVRDLTRWSEVDIVNSRSDIGEPGG